MTSLNNVKRVKYENNRKDAFITLNEYIIFFGESSDEKYIVFKFKNEVDQYLYGFQFELSQYNDVDNLIEKSVLTYKDIKINNLETFVPDKKLKLNKNCDHVQVDIVTANFERMNFAHGKTTEQKFDYNDYKNILGEKEEEQIVVAKKKKKELRKENKEYKKNKKSADLSTVKIRDITRQNKSKRPWSFAITCALILIVFMGLHVDSTIKVTSGLTVGGINYKIVSETECVALSCTNTKGEIAIPDSIAINGKDYYVVKVSANCFKNNSGIEVVVFEATSSHDLVIVSGAFANCSNLTAVLQTGDCNIIVQSGAFTGSPVEQVGLQYATINNKAFTSEYLTIFTFYNAQPTTSKFYMLFDDVSSNAELHKFAVIQYGTKTSDFYLDFEQGN